MKPTHTPRPACEDDIEQVVAIESYSNKPAWTRNAFTAEFEKKGSFFWVLTDDETDQKISSYIVFSFLGEQAHIETFAVDRSERRKGFGELTLRFMINYILRQGGDSIYLEVRQSNTAAIALYQKLGFVVLRAVKGLYGDGEDAYAMLYRCSSSPLKSEEDDKMDVTDVEPKTYIN
jgi:ribosomal-protein-alanine N-acetyltransferase